MDMDPVVSAQPPKNSPLLRQKGKELAVRICLTLLVMFLPLAVVYVLTRSMGVDMFRALPRWNDETWWYMQYGAMSEYGRPLGYFGYAGTHARVGTFAAWGMYPTLVIGLLARIFGWGLHAFVYYNFALLAGASLIFILLAKPNTRSMILLAATNSVSYLALSYGLICMNEVVRYSMAIVLTGIMYRIITVPKVSLVRLILRCTLVPLLLAYAVCFYKILAAFIPIYVYAMLHRLKPGWRLPIAIAVTIVAVRYLPRLNSPTCAPYVVSGDSSAAASSTTALAVNAALAARVKFLTFLQDLSIIDPISLLTKGGSGATKPFLIWFCTLLYIGMGFLLWRMHATAKKRDMTSFTVQGAALLLLLCFWGGHILLYTTSDWTFMRGCNTAVMCAMFLAAMLPKEEGHVWRAMFITCLAGVIVFLNVFSSVIATGDRFSTDAQEQIWAEQRQQLAELIVLDEDAQDPWSNTVVICHTGTDVYYSLPYGVGLNSRVSDVINRNAKYVVLGKESADYDPTGDIQTLQDGGHVLRGETDKYYVFENMSRAFS